MDGPQPINTRHADFQSRRGAPGWQLCHGMGGRLGVEYAPAGIPKDGRLSIDEIGTI